MVFVWVAVLFHLIVLHSIGAPGVDVVCTQGEQQVTALAMACGKGFVDLALFLLDRGASINHASVRLTLRPPRPVVCVAAV